MKQKITASRLSSGNKMFPPCIIIEDNGLRINFPGFFNDKEEFVSYADISSISFDAPIVGFTKLHLNIRGQVTNIEGFYKSDIQNIMKIWKEKRK